MRVRTLLSALALCAAVAPAAQAQQPNHPYFNAAPEAAPTSSVEIGRGRVDFQNTAQRRLVLDVMPRIEKAVAINLANPETAEFTGLRTGRSQKALVVCGVVESVGAAGGKQKARFIARPSVATLETPINRQAFQAGWKDTGCGF